MNKKLIIGVVAVVAVIVAVVIGILAITGTIGVKTSSPAVNSTISVPVIIKNNPGFFAGEFHIAYDTELLQYVDCGVGELSMKIDPEYLSNIDGAVNFILQNNEFENSKENGVLAYLNFKVLKKADDYKISVKDNTMLGNFDGKEVKADIIIGDIKTK